MAIIIDITDRLKQVTTKVEESDPFVLYPVIDDITQELLGYTIRFPLPEEVYVASLPEGVVSIKGKPKHKIPDYKDVRFKGQFILDPSERFVGTVYDDDSLCFEVGGARIGGAGVLYRRDGHVNLICHSEKGVVTHNCTALVISDPIKLLLAEYKKY